MTKFAMIFPGQGSQKIGMLAELADSYPIIKETFAIASEHIGVDLWQLAGQGPIDELNKTYHTQPVLLTASIALWRLWQQKTDALPSVVAGHSLGEYSALVAAGVIDFLDAVELVRDRGLFMQQAIPEHAGAMAAILGLADHTVQTICKELSHNSTELVAPVNYNSPGQIVIAGHRAKVEEATIVCRAAGAKRALLLPVSVPSHCILMESAALKLSEKLATISFHPPKIDCVNNVDVQVEFDSIAIKQALVRQLCSPVRWTETVQKIEKSGIHIFMEVGAGNVLTGLVKRITENSINIAINDNSSLNHALEIQERGQNDL